MSDRTGHLLLLALSLILFVLIAGYSIGTPSFGGKAGWSGNQDMPGIFSASSLWISALYTLLIFGIISLIGVLLSGDSLKKFITGFLTVFFLAILAQFISSYAGFKNLGLETVLFSLLLGLLIGNLGKLPDWLRPGVLTKDCTVKIGLYCFWVPPFSSRISLPPALSDLFRL
ncbi:MAG: hypothetical protein U5L72_02820 [Bacteroidales bacterium]|nr:hypothetical protein [Bacteroidales bacterium]